VAVAETAKSGGEVADTPRTAVIAETSETVVIEGHQEEDEDEVLILFIYRLGAENFSDKFFSAEITFRTNFYFRPEKNFSDKFLPYSHCQN
jgi:hypothetical protein